MKPRVLVDTTYLLPLFGFKVKGFGRDDLRLLIEKCEVYFNPVSLIEIRWVGSRLAKLGRIDYGLFRKVYAETVDAVLGGEEMRPTQMLDAEICEYEALLEDAGLRDYFDRVIAATAKAVTGLLLTEDAEIARVISGLEGFSDLRVVSWRELKKLIVAGQTKEKGEWPNPP